MRTIKPGKFLSCGCCGEGFRTWEGYEDQDQDNGYGICAGCQFDLEERNEAEFDKLIACVRGGFKNPDLLAKFDATSRDEQKAFAYRCLEKGIIGWKIEPAKYQRGEQQ